MDQRLNIIIISNNFVEGTFKIQVGRFTKVHATFSAVRAACQSLRNSLLMPKVNLVSYVEQHGNIEMVLFPCKYARLNATISPMILILK